MANKNLFTKFASLAMAGALAFSAVPVAGLNGVIPAQAAADDGMVFTTAGQNLVWNPDNTGNLVGTGTDINKILSINSGGDITNSGMNYTIKFNSKEVVAKTTSNYKVPTTTPGEYTITATTDGDYSWTGTYDVAKLDLKYADPITLTASEVTYNGDYQEPVVNSKSGVKFTKKNKNGYDGETITAEITTSVGGWYEVTKGGEDVGTYTSKVKALDLSSNPLDGEQEFDFKINAFQINNASVAAGYAKIDIGQKAKDSAYNPKVDVKAMLTKADGSEDKTLEEGTDYSVTYEDISSTKGQATITFSGNYEGTVVEPYTIVDDDHDLANATLTMKDSKGKTVDADHHITYDGTTCEITPTVVIKLDGKDNTLKKGTDYTVSYEYDDDSSAATKANAGVVTVNVDGIGDFGGRLVGQFTIDPMSIDGTGVTATAQTGLVYNGLAQEAKITLKAGNTELNYKKDGAADDYVINYEGNVSAGDAIAICEGVGNYTDTKTVKFTIAPYSFKNSNVEIEDVPNQVYTGTEVTPAITAKFTNGDNKTVDLVQGDDYTLTYKNNIKVGTSATVEAEGTGNFEKSVSKTFKIKEAAYDLANATVEVENASVPYDGKNHSAVIKSVKVTKDDGTVKTLTNGSDYEVKNTVGKEVGTYTATIQAPKNSDYAGSQAVAFEITAHDLAGFSLKKSSVKYNGKNQKPELVVAEGTRFDGGNMTEGVDYEVSGIKNIKNVGKLTVKVTGLGGYAGKEQSLTFKVTKADQPMKVSTKTASVKASKVAKKNQTIKASKVFSVSKNQGSVSYKKTSGNSKIKVASNGKITVKKGLKKGTYKIKVKVTAKGNSNYNSGNKTVKATIKVK